jgi:hypothetical protein
VRATLTGPRDWRLLLLWLGWALSTATAIGTVIIDARERNDEHEKLKLHS